MNDESVRAIATSRWWSPSTISPRLTIRDEPRSRALSASNRSSAKRLKRLYPRRATATPPMTNHASGAMGISSVLAIRSLRFRFAHLEHAPADFLSVETGDGRSGVIVVAELDEAEPFGLTARALARHVRRRRLAKR